ncbi:MAG: DUF4159 domain-containing protein [Phycisphaerales bacterium]|nr:DUF4159 domain-containing protein [Phycisphaerales bacterium]
MRAAKANKNVVDSANVIAAIKRGVAYLLKQENLNASGKSPFWEHGIIAGGIPISSSPVDNRNRQRPPRNIRGRRRFKKPPPRRKPPKVNKAKTVPANQYGGETALVVESLLDVEQSLRLPDISQFAPVMAKPIKFLTKLKPGTTYVASFQANAMTLLPNKPIYRRTLLQDFRYLLDDIHASGGYFYGFEPNYPNPHNGLWDNSNSQYGVLGMWACAHQGLEVPFRYWELAGRHWRETQSMSGTWEYNKSVRGRTMTFGPAGVASLLICDEFLQRGAGSLSSADQNVIRGLKWIDANFPTDVSRMSLYAMYGYERVQLASGLQQFGGVDCYKALAARLLKTQKADGSWNIPFPQSSPIICTAYALLVLDRGLNPVIMSKLQYTPAYYGQWNARQRDVANFASWITQTFEAPVNWQVVSSNAPMSQWLNAPIVFISGSRDPKFTPEQIQKLTDYVDNGGMVFCSCNAQSAAFKQAMIKYGQEVVHNQYEAHVLSKKSFLYTMQPWYHPTVSGEYLGISNGVRYVWIISDQDLGAQWQAHRFNNRDAFEVPANLYLYAIGNGSPADRLHSLFIPPAHGAMRRQISINRLQYTGNWNPEPGAWPRMGRLAARNFSTGVTVKTVTADALSQAAPLTTLTGTHSFTLPPAQVNALRKYLNSGGMLFADAAGGHPTFSNGMTQLVKALYPKAVLQNIPMTDSLVTGNFPGGVAIAKVQYRKFYVSQLGMKTTPDLLGVKQGNRWVIVFSPVDVTSGFLGTNTWGILGYAPASAQSIARNVMMYALAHKR